MSDTLTLKIENKPEPIVVGKLARVIDELVQLLQEEAAWLLNQSDKTTSHEEIVKRKVLLSKVYYELFCEYKRDQEKLEEIGAGGSNVLIEKTKNLSEILLKNESMLKARKQSTSKRINAVASAMEQKSNKHNGYKLIRGGKPAASHTQAMITDIGI